MITAVIFGIATRSDGQLVPSTWSGVANEDWSNAGKWTQGVPGSGHSAHVPSGGAVAVSDVRSVGAVSVSGGSVGGAGSLTIESTGSTWSGGALRGTGQFKIASGATLELTGPDPKTFDRGDGNGFGGRKIDNAGTITVTGSGNLLGGDGGQFLNQSTGVLDLKNDITIGHSGAGDAPSFTNSGTLRKSAGAGTATVAQAFTSSGLVDVTSGTVQFASPVTSNSGIFTAASGTTLTFTGGQTFNTGTRFTGQGAIKLASGTSSLNGAISSENLTFEGGALQGTATVTGSVKWTGGNWHGTGSYTVPQGSTLAISGAAAKTYARGDGNGFGGRTIENFGDITWADAGALLGGDGGQIINRGTGKFLVNNDTTLGHSGIGDQPTFTNQGTFQKASSSGVTAISGLNFVNSNLVDIASGTLSFGSAVTSNGGTFRAGANTAILFTGGQTFNGTAFDATGSIRITGGGTAVSGTVTAGGIEFAGGTLAGSASVNGNLKWTGGEWRGASTLTLNTGANLSLSGVADKTINRGDGNGFGGRIVQADGGSVLSWTDSGRIVGNDGAGIRISADGLFEISNNSSFTHGGAGDRPFLANTGTVRKLSSGVTTFNGISFANTGRLEIKGGTLSLIGGGGLANDNTVEVQAGALTSAASGATSTGGTFNVFTDATLRYTAGTNTMVNATFTGGGLTEVDGGTLVTSGVKLTGRMRLAAGAIGGGGGFAVGSGTETGTFTWSGGHLTGTGTLAVGSLGQFVIDGVIDKQFYRGDGNGFGGRIISNLGTVTWSGSGSLLGGDGAQVQNQAGGLFNITGDATFGYTGSGDAPTFTNAGTVRKSAGVAVTDFSRSFANNGVLESKSGTIRLSGGGSGSGEFLAAGGEIDLAGSYTLNSGAKLLGPNATRVTAGNLTVPSLATASVGDSLTRGWLSLQNGIIDGAGTLLIDALGEMDWLGGGLRGTGVLRVAYGGRLDLVGAVNHDFARGDGNGFGGRLIENLGTIEWSDGHVRGGDGARIYNGPNAVFDIRAAGSITWTGTGDWPTFENAGTLRKSTAGITTVSQTVFKTSGRTEVLAGTLEFISGGLTSNAGTFHANAVGSTLTFAGGQTFNDGTTFTGPGLHQATAGATTLAGTINASRFVLAGGSLYGTASVVGTLEWAGGDMRGANTLTIPSGSALQVTGVGDRTFLRGDGNGFGGRIIDNSGDVIVANSGHLLGADGGQIVNRPLAVFEIRNDRTLGHTGSGEAPAFVNQGTLRKTSTTGTTLFSGMTLLNTGTVDVALGHLQFNSTVTNNSPGKFVVPADSTVTFVGGQTFNSGSVISGAGLARVTAGNTTFNGNIALQNFEFAGGVLLGTATVTSGAMRWTGGEMRGANTLTIENGAALVVTGTGDRSFTRGDGNGFGGRIIENRGTMVVENVGNLLGSDGARLLNRSMGVVELRNDATLGHSGTGDAPSFSNEGTLGKLAGAGTSAIAVPFTNTGTLLIGSGTLAFTSSFANTNGSVELLHNAALTVPGALNIGSGLLQGWGRVNAPAGVSIGLASGPAGSGGIVFAGNLVINGNVSLTPTSLVAFPLAGATQGHTSVPGYGFMDVNGALTLGGLLSFSFENGFWTQVSPDQQFVLAQATSLSGAFGNAAPGTRLFSQDGAGSFKVNYGLGSLFGANRLVLTEFQPVPEPATWALMILGTLVVCLGIRRRR